MQGVKKEADYRVPIKSWWCDMKIEALNPADTPLPPYDTTFIHAEKAVDLALVE